MVECGFPGRWAKVLPTAPSRSSISLADTNRQRVKVGLAYCGAAHLGHGGCREDQSFLGLPLFGCDPAEHPKESVMGILLFLFLLFLGQRVAGVPYSSIGRSKHAEYESVCHFDVLLKLFEFWPKNKLLKLFI